MNLRAFLASATVHAGLVAGAAAWATGGFAAYRPEPPSLAFAPVEAIAPHREAAPPPDQPEVVPERTPDPTAAPEPAPLPILPEERARHDIEPLPRNELPRDLLVRLRPAPVPPAPEPAPATLEAEPAEPAPATTFVEARALDARNSKPEYPHDAVRRGWHGTVGLRLWIDASGRVTDIRVISPCRHASLNRSALRAARDWVFEPARRGDQQVASQKDVPVEFRLVDR